MLRWCRCSSQECSWGCGALSPPSTGKGCAWGRWGGCSTSLAHPARRRQGTPGLGFAFDVPFPAPSNVKQKLWPPVPDLHRTLGSFLRESGKHGQVRGPGLGSPRPSPPRGAGRRAAPTAPPLSPPHPPRPTPSTSSRRRRRPSCPACWRCCPARGGRRARRPRRRSTLPAGCPAPTSPTSPTCS